MYMSFRLLLPIPLNRPHKVHWYSMPICRGKLLFFYELNQFNEYKKNQRTALRSNYTRNAHLSNRNTWPWPTEVNPVSVTHSNGSQSKSEQLSRRLHNHFEWGQAYCTQIHYAIDTHLNEDHNLRTSIEHLGIMPIWIEILPSYDLVQSTRLNI